MLRILTDCVDNIINLENASDCLTGESDGAGADQERLHHVLLQDVGDGALSHINTSSFLTLSMSVSQLSYGT